MIIASTVNTVGWYGLVHRYELIFKILLSGETPKMTKKNFKRITYFRSQDIRVKVQRGYHLCSYKNVSKHFVLRALKVKKSIHKEITPK